MGVTARARKGRSRESSKGVVQSAARAVRIMRLLFLAREGRHLGELSEELGLHKTTALRLLRTLIAEGVVRKESPEGHYRLHPMSWMTIATRVPSVSLPQVIKDLLQELAASTGATAMVVAPMVGTRSMVATMWALPQRVMRIDPNVVTAAPMHACAPGKCYLASLPEDELRKWMRHDLERVTGRTTTDVSALAKELTLVRKRGYAVDRDEFVAGAAGLAVPILDQAGNMVAALTLVAPAGEVTRAGINGWVPVLRRASLRLSEALASINESVTAECSTAMTPVGTPGPTARSHNRC